MKLDTRTLPTGYRVTTENPRVVRLTAGKVTKLNFGASISRVVKIDLDGKAFVPGKTQALPALEDGIDQLVRSLDEKPSVLRLTYFAIAGDKKLGNARLAVVEKLVSKKWKAIGAYRLEIEARIVVGQ
jgi:large repetitive protein